MNVPILLFAACAVTTTCQPPALREGEVRLTRIRRSYGLDAEKATLASICRVLQRETGCQVSVDKKASEKILTFRLGARPADRLLLAIARRAGTRLEIVHHVTPLPPGASPRRGPPAFAEAVEHVVTGERLSASDIAELLDARIRWAPVLTGKARVFAPGLPLHRVLDQVAAQLGASWTTVVTLLSRSPMDAESEAAERAMAHYSDLARLSSGERRDELEADLSSVSDLAAREDMSGLQRMVEDIKSLATIYQQVPGEHRGPASRAANGILDDYEWALNRASPDQEELLAVVRAAIEETRLRLGRLQ